jgi:branched-subunit amino acid aminotransferase/4-amino-4-deoxychorismate lyase
VDGQGNLLEASCSNVFWIEQEVLYTPDPALPLLFGIKIQQVLEAAEQIGWKTKLVQVKPAGISPSSIFFLTNSIRGIQSVHNMYGESEKTAIYLEPLKAALDKVSIKMSLHVF